MQGRKRLLLTEELYNKLSFFIKNNDEFTTFSDVIRTVWSDFIEKDFPLVGYSRLTGTKLNTRQMPRTIPVKMDRVFIKEIEKKLELLKLKYYKRGKEFYLYSYVTAELLERFLEERGFKDG